MDPISEPSRQPQHVKVLHSIERPGLTPVYGTTVPPSGLSGRLRSLAFRFSEGDLRHWMLLLLADRVNVGEGLLADLAGGQVPNPFAEMGLAMEWRHNRLAFMRRAVTLLAVAGLGVWLLRRRRLRH